MNKKTFFTSTLLGTLFLASLPTPSYADCSDIKARYWRCTRASMIGEKCAAEDNVSIPPECLGGNESESQKNDSTPNAASTSSSSKKESSIPFIYPKADLVPKTPVKVINIKPLNKKHYIETEEDVEQFTTKVKAALLHEIKKGKKVRLQFN